MDGFYHSYLVLPTCYSFGVYSIRWGRIYKQFTPNGVDSILERGGAFDAEGSPLLTLPRPHQPCRRRSRRDRTLFVRRTLIFHAAQQEGALSCSGASRQSVNGRHWRAETRLWNVIRRTTPRGSRCCGSCCRDCSCCDANRAGRLGSTPFQISRYVAESTSDRFVA